MLRWVRQRWIAWRIRSLRLEIDILIEIALKARSEMQTLEALAMDMHGPAIRQMPSVKEKLDYYEEAIRKAIQRLLTLKQSQRYMDPGRKQ